METEQIIKLIEAVAASGLTEFEYTAGEVTLRLKAAQEIYTAVSQPQTAIPVPPMLIPADQESESKAAVNEDEIIKSPLVGTFYSAPSEDAQPFAAVGDTVKKGQVIGIIETMKLMNEVESDRDGVITAILIENEQVVEFGQPLFAIR